MGVNARVSHAGGETMARRYWLFKSEPGAYSFDDLVNDGVAEWDGVRNFKARNYLRDEVKAGDGVLFYHSNADPYSHRGRRRGGP